MHIIYTRIIVTKKNKCTLHQYCIFTIVKIIDVLQFLASGHTDSFCRF